jgi:hypothetical protein
MLTQGLETTLFKYKPTRSTYFQCINYLAVTDEKHFEFIAL